MHVGANHRWFVGDGIGSLATRLSSSCNRVACGMDHANLSALRDRHPAWRLLASTHAPLVVSFLRRVFMAPNVRVISEADLA